MSDPLHILGAGSLGLLLAARCTLAGVPCQLILRTREAVCAWRQRDNLLLLEQQGQSTPLKVAGELADESAQPIRLLVVATKAWAVADALDSVVHRLTPDSQILLLQNGLGSQQAVSRRLPDHRVLYASVTDGAWLRSPNQVVWAGSGQTLIGDPAAGPAPDWLQRLTRAGIDWRWESDILPVLWLKLAVNCAINPLSALHDCPNGEVPERAGAIFEPLLAELHALLSSEGVSLSLAEPPEVLSVGLNDKGNRVIIKLASASGKSYHWFYTDRSDNATSPITQEIHFINGEANLAERMEKALKHLATFCETKKETF